MSPMAERSLKPSCESVMAASLSASVPQTRPQSRAFVWFSTGLPYETTSKLLCLRYSRLMITPSSTTCLAHARRIYSGGANLTVIYRLDVVHGEITEGEMDLELLKELVSNVSCS